MVREDGYVKVLDFGLARLHPLDAGPESLLKDTNRLVGTARYMSPEQARGDRVGPGIGRVLAGDRPVRDGVREASVSSGFVAGHAPRHRICGAGALARVKRRAAIARSSARSDAALEKDPARRPTAAAIDAALAPDAPSFPARTRPPATDGGTSDVEGPLRRLVVAGVAASVVVGRRSSSFRVVLARTP